MQKKKKKKKKNQPTKQTNNLLIAAQINDIRTDWIRTKIDDTPLNDKCWLCHDKDEAVNHLIREHSILSQRVQDSVRLGEKDQSLRNM